MPATRAGRPPKPTALKKLEGTHRPSRTRKEPQPKTAGIPSCPTWLHREAKREWRRLAPTLYSLGLLTELDRSTLAAHCQAYADWYAATKVIAKEGATFTSPNGHICQRPEVALAKNALKAMRDFGFDLGLSPSARSRLNVKETPKPAQEMSEMERLLYTARNDNPWSQF